MDTIIKVTSITAHRTPEGMRVSGTYSIIDSEGQLIESNKRYTRIVLDQNINAAIEAVNDWFYAIVAGQEAGR